jgi:TatD DNase family protein
MFVDIHAHLNNPNLVEDIEEVLARAKEAGVGKIVCVGSDFETSVKAIELSKKYIEVYASVGCHPHACLSFNKQMAELIYSAKNNKKVVAIGEIGLDYYNLDLQIAELSDLELDKINKEESVEKQKEGPIRQVEDTKRNSSFKEISEEQTTFKGISKEQFVEKQKEVFQKQLELANEIGLPVMIHMRDATSDTLNILESAYKNGLLKNGGLLHCYSGSAETAKRVFDLGFYISLGGAITFKNSRNMPDVLREIGLERVTLETDCPYLSPEPFRGKRNEPSNIPLIGNKIAQILDMNVKDVELTTTKNCYKVFLRLK